MTFALAGLMFFSACSAQQKPSKPNNMEAKKNNPVFSRTSSDKVEISEDEWKKIDSFIHHDRDEHFTYVAMEQWRGKYLVQNRVTNEIFETPQVAYLLIAATLFQNYTNNRLQWVKDYYDAISNHDIKNRPVVADENGWVLDGNHRVTAARARGLETIPALVPYTK